MDRYPFLEHNSDDAISLWNGLVYRHINDVQKQFDFRPKYEKLGHYDIEVYLKAIFMNFTIILLYLR